MTPPPMQNVAPPGWADHVFERTWQIDRPRAAVWRWLNDPATFTDSQLWPFRVEFIKGGMTPGVLNAHHGPLMLFAGYVGERTDAGEVLRRDLVYTYGSYALSLRLIRPTLLRFEAREPAAGRTRLDLRLESHVHPRIAGGWTLAQRGIWAMFPRWLRRSVPE